MADESRAAKVREARAAYAARREAFRRELRREGTFHRGRSRRRWQAFLKKSRPTLLNGDVIRAGRAEGGHRAPFF